MGPSTAPPPGGTLHQRAADRFLGPWALLLVLLGTALCTAALPLAPVERTTAVVEWPRAGEPLESTMLTLLPYRPLAMELVLPCAALTDADDDAEVFSTFPLGSGAGQGLAVRGSTRGVEVVSEGTTLYHGPVVGGRQCSLAVQVHGTRSTVLLDGERVAALDVEPPRVASLATALPPDTTGASVRLQADSRYETSPTLLKRLLLTGAVLGAVAALLALVVADRGRARAAGPGRTDRTARWPQDLAVAAVLGLWLLVGPMMADDGYNVAVAEGFAATGYVGNYYHWYNAPEAPFALVQQAFVPLVELTRAPVALRVPALLAGLATWLLLSRVLLPRLGGTWSPTAVRWAAVPVLLAWWMPFNNSLRPEPWVALAGTAVLALVVLAAERSRVLLLGLAGSVAALSVAAAPSGLMAAAPLLVLGPRVLTVLRAAAPAARAPWWLLGAVALVPAGVVVGVAVFADQPLAAVLEATRVHQVIGPSVPWWQDIVRYEFLFGLGEMGTSARRVAVLTALFTVVLVLFLRRPLHDRGAGLLPVAAGCYGVALVLLVLAPSKWTHHFGGTAGFAVLLLVGLAVHAGPALRGERGGLRVGAVVAVVAAGVVAAGFAGPNAWWAYGSLDVDPQLPPALASPLLWLALAVAVVLVVAATRSRGRPGLAALAAVPSTVLVIGLAASVVTMLGTHVSAARDLRGGWSMASQNIGHLTDGDCGMGDHLEVMVASPLAARPGLGQAEQSVPGAFAQGGGSFLPGPGSLPPEALRWGTLGSLPGDPNAATGTLTTTWFDLPELGPEQGLGVVVSGRSGGGNEVALEFADAADPSRVLQRVRLAEELDGAYWQQAAAPLTGPPPGDLVRLVATDDSTDLGGWLAVSQPVLITPTVLAEVGADRPVHVDWTLRLTFPCLPQVPVAHGLAQLPELVLTAEPRAGAEAAYGLALDEDQGGAFAMARQASAPEVLPTRLPFVSEEAVLRGQDLGTLSVWLYPARRDGFTLTLDRETVSGWEWGYRYPVPTVPDPLGLPGPRLVDKGPGTEPQRDTRPGVQPPEFAEP